MPASTQTRLLRLLQDGQFQRLGGTEILSADVRIIAAAAPGIETAVAEGRFRSDLYYRLRDVTIHVPPLRDRSEDIPELAHYMMFRFNQQLGTCVTSISPEALEKLQAHRWPGNIRELQSTLREALGDPTGSALLRGGAPEPIGRWLMMPPKPEARTDYADWMSVLERVWGRRRFVRWDLTPNMVYAC